MLRSIFYCEECQGQLETAAAVDIPPHWIELLDGTHPDRELHFCTWHCLRAYADGRSGAPSLPRLVPTDRL